MWLALLTSTTFSELGEYVDKVLPDSLKDKFIEEVVNMSKDNFVLHDWEWEKMAQLKEAEEKLYYENMLKEGIEKGVKEGIEKGIEKNIIDTIKAMLKEKASYEFISKITNKTIEEIKKIEQSNN